ncbi:hypothetical protein HJC23_001618 [Cyclotella cryptica]|uniref:2'-phosphotransferase n=1 Tax=Cyclotella cryptica TaxID=29204 RepID=A0ABD3QMG9_9STRA|eukprot:CCRYP_004658-RA/>CCRYP_004658-RA protein AED:0.00 eAED:0.00 QI:207/-1/1/1/-1/1/1/437/369
MEDQTGTIGVSVSVLDGGEHAEKKTKLTQSTRSDCKGKDSTTSNNNNSVPKHSNNSRVSDNKRNNKSRKVGQRNTGNEDVELSKSLSWVLRHTAPSLGLRPASDGYIPVEDVLSLNHPRFRKGSTAKSRNAADAAVGSSSNDTCHDRKYTVDDVIRVVENNDKQRFRLEYMDLSCKSSSNRQNKGDTNVNTAKLNEISVPINSTQTVNLVLCIRANQGHSYKNIIESDKLLTPLTDEELSDPSLSIIHGTTRKAWDEHIRIEGLRRMKRNHIHFATGLPATCTVTSEDGTQQNCTEKKKKFSPISGMRTSSQIYIYVDGRKCAADGVQFYRSDNGVILTAGTKDEGILPVKYFKKVVLASSGKILYDDD